MSIVAGSQLNEINRFVYIDIFLYKFCKQKLKRPLFSYTSWGYDGGRMSEYNRVMSIFNCFSFFLLIFVDLIDLVESK